MSNSRKVNQPVGFHVPGFEILHHNAKGDKLEIIALTAPIVSDYSTDFTTYNRREIVPHHDDTKCGTPSTKKLGRALAELPGVYRVQVIGASNVVVQIRNGANKKQTTIGVTEAILSFEETNP